MARSKRPIIRGSDAGPMNEGGTSVQGKPWYRSTDVELFSRRYEELRSSLGLKKVRLDDKDREALVEEARRRDPRLKNLLDVVFVKKEGLGREGEYLMVPVYESRRWEKLARFFGLKTVRRIRLDDYGWSVWSLIDGEKDIGEIGAALRERFGEDVEPLYPRLSKFMAYLVHLGLAREKV